MSWDLQVQELGTRGPNLSLNSFTDEETAAREREDLTTVIDPVSRRGSWHGLASSRAQASHWLGVMVQSEGRLLMSWQVWNTYMRHRAIGGWTQVSVFSKWPPPESISKPFFFSSKNTWIDPVIGVLSVRQSKAPWCSSVINKLCETSIYPNLRVRMKSTAWPCHVANVSNQCSSYRKTDSHSYPMSLPWVLTKIILTEHWIQGLAHIVSAR